MAAENEQESTCPCGGNCGSQLTTADLEHGIKEGSRRHGRFRKAYHVIAATLPISMFMWQGTFATLFVLGLMGIYFIEANASALSQQVGFLKKVLGQTLARAQAQVTEEDDDGKGQYL